MNALKSMVLYCLGLTEAILSQETKHLQADFRRKWAYLLNTFKGVCTCLRAEFQGKAGLKNWNFQKELTCVMVSLRLWSLQESRGGQEKPTEED